MLCVSTLIVMLGCSRAPSSSAERGEASVRIVSLAPSVTETLFAIGAGNEVVGVSEYCDYPPSVRRLPKIGTFLTPNIEAIVALRPTLVIGLATSADIRELKALDAMGISTLMVDDSSIVEIERSIERIGDAVGRSVEARRELAELRRHLAVVGERLRDTPERRVLMVVGHDPMVAVGPGNFLDQLLALAHAANIADASPQAWPRLSLEYIIAERPEVILDGQMGSDPTVQSSFWSGYRWIPAVRNHRVFGYPQDPTLHPGPRIAQTLTILARLIHPEAFGENASAHEQESGR
jgi:iron complex transport system substrate-binding protein